MIKMNSAKSEAYPDKTGARSMQIDNDTKWRTYFD